MKKAYTDYYHIRYNNDVRKTSPRKMGHVRSCATDAKRYSLLNLVNKMREPNMSRTVQKVTVVDTQQNKPSIVCHYTNMLTTL